MNMFCKFLKKKKKENPFHRSQVNPVLVILLWKPYLFKTCELMGVEYLCPMPLTTDLEPRVILTLVRRTTC